MRPRPFWLWLVAVVAISLTASRAVLAVSPVLIMVYGDQLQKPIVIDAVPQAPYGFLWWRGGRFDAPSTWTIPTRLAGRSYLKLAIFWGGNEMSGTELKPENASQHGRLYPRSGSQPAVVVVTVPMMELNAGVPVPASLDQFDAGWVLDKPPDLADLRYFGVPGF